MPPPSKAFVFIDERSDSIDDGYFWAIALSPRSWPHIVASWHNRGNVLSFGDAHAEHWRWLEPTTLTAKFPFGTVTAPVDRDWEHVRGAYASKDLQFGGGKLGTHQINQSAAQQLDCGR